MSAEREMRTAAELLRAAAKRVSMGWCQRAIARNADGNEVPITSPQACRWCLLGALAASGLCEATAAVVTQTNLLLEEVTGTLFKVAWNDAPERTQASVVAALLKAAELAEAAK